MPRTDPDRDTSSAAELCGRVFIHPGPSAPFVRSQTILWVVLGHIGLVLGTYYETRQCNSPSLDTIGRDIQVCLSRKGFLPCARSYSTRNSWRNVLSSTCTPPVDEPGLNGLGAQ